MPVEVMAVTVVLASAVVAVATEMMAEMDQMEGMQVSLPEEQMEPTELMAQMLVTVVMVVMAAMVETLGTEAAYKYLSPKIILT